MAETPKARSFLWISRECEVQIAPHVPSTCDPLSVNFAAEMEMQGRRWRD